MDRAIPAFIFLLASFAPVQADVGVELGRAEYMDKCAVCHGQNADGAGPVSKFLRIETADLTTLAKANGGEFPFERVYGIIDGRTEVAVHGPRKMPVWGSEYLGIWKRETDPTKQTQSAETFVAERILSLIRYLETVQTE